MRKAYLFIYIVSLGLILNSCYYDSIVLEEPTDLPDVVSYSKNIQPIWDSQCISCHSGSVAPDLRKDKSYSQLLQNGWIIPNKPSDSKLYKALIGEAVQMPPSGKMDQAKIALVQKWIADGALNN